MELLNPTEKFIINLFIILFGFLAIVSLVTITFIIRKKNMVDDLAVRAPIAKKTVRKIKSMENEYTEKLGEKVVQYMIEVAWSDNEALVKDRMEKIRKECERLNNLPMPEQNKEIISTVFIWSKRFNLKRHLTEMRVLRTSSQIIYDKKKHDFKLLIAGE